eukprot:snap_masked-scaffold697_size109876-processed-gene-0.11 protein:Tk05852 transcript:snap_masked-scaffold697_size109876-processed-gene-0.11-mRNA-1 annotation:"interleukin-12 receptor subunit beta-2-like"
MNISSTSSEKMELASDNDTVSQACRGNRLKKKKSSSSSASWTDRLENNDLTRTPESPATQIRTASTSSCPPKTNKLIMCNGRKIDLQDLRESLALAEKIAQESLEAKSSPSSPEDKPKKSPNPSNGKPFSSQRQILKGALRKISSSGSLNGNNNGNNKTPQRKKSSRGSLLKLTKSSGAKATPFVPPKQLLLYLVRIYLQNEYGSQKPSLVHEKLSHRIFP